MKIKNRYNRSYIIHDDDIYWQKMLSKGIFQINNIRKLYELVPKCRTIIDVGSNIGTNSIEYSTWAKTVHSFEPTPELYNLLCTNLALNRVNIDTVRWDKNLSMNRVSDVYTYCVALGNREEKVNMVTHGNNKGKNYIDVNVGDVEVVVKTLDSYNFLDVDIIKIDTEGYELFVLEGAINTIMKYKPVIQTELHKGLFKRQGITIQDVGDWFYKIGYYAIDKKNVIQPRILPTEHSGVDLFWLPK